MTFYTKIAGVTFEGRQAIIRKLYRTGELDIGTELILRREPDNSYDPFAVAVFTSNGQQLGYLSKDCAKQVSINMNSGMRYSAYVSGVTGGDAGFSYGVNIKIEYEGVSNLNEDKENENKGETNMYSKAIYNLFTEALSQKLKVKYNENIENGSIVVPELGIDSSMKSVSTIIEVREDDCVISGIYDNFSVTSNNMQKVCELLMRINMKYIFPQIKLNYNDNIVLCEYRQHFVGELLNIENAARAFMIVGLHLQKYANAIMAVSLGLQSPEEAEKTVDD